MQFYEMQLQRNEEPLGGPVAVAIDEQARRVYLWVPDLGVWVINDEATADYVMPDVTAERQRIFTPISGEEALLLKQAARKLDLRRDSARRRLRVHEERARRPRGAYTDAEVGLSQGAAQIDYKKLRQLVEIRSSRGVTGGWTTITRFPAEAVSDAAVRMRKQYVQQESPLALSPFGTQLEVQVTSAVGKGGDRELRVRYRKQTNRRQEPAKRRRVGPQSRSQRWKAADSSVGAPN